MSAKAEHPEEFTVDELASRAGMTVRNVRAYAGRGLIPAPRLEGRTGYYTLEHLQRLQLIRELLDRGYTLAAVQRAITHEPDRAVGYTLDLLRLLDEPHRGADPEIISKEALAAIAGVRPDDALLETMSEMGLAAEVDDDTLRLLQPALVRAAAAATAIGLSSETVMSLYPVARKHAQVIADVFVSKFVEEIFQPFAENGFPENDWERILGSVEVLLPIASQVVLGIFREQLGNRIDAEIGEQLRDMRAPSD